MATAMIRCLRRKFPLAQIDMVVREDFLPLIEYNPHLDRKLSVSRNKGLRSLFELLKEANRQRYDLVYDAHRSLRTRLLMPFLNCSEKCYLKKHYLRRSLSLTFKWKSLIKNSPRMLERFVEPLSPLGVSYDHHGPEVFLPDSPDSMNLKSLFSRLGLDPNKRYVGFVPSAQWPGKRWPLENFRSVLLTLLAKTNESFIIFGGPTDHFCSELTKGVSADRVINLQGKISLLEVFQVLTRVKCCLSNDTGLMHVADAMGIPNIVIFGPTNSDLGCRPFHPLSQILEKDLWCRPCSKNGEAPCIRIERWCLSLITPEEASCALQNLFTQLGSLKPS